MEPFTQMPCVVTNVYVQVEPSNPYNTTIIDIAKNLQKIPGEGWTAVLFRKATVEIGKNEVHISGEINWREYHIHKIDAHKALKKYKIPQPIHNHIKTAWFGRKVYLKNGYYEKIEGGIISYMYVTGTFQIIDQEKLCTHKTT